MGSHIVTANDCFAEGKRKSPSLNEAHEANDEMKDIA